MNNLKQHLKNIARMRRSIYSSLELNKIFKERAEKQGFKKSKKRIDELYLEWRSLEEDLTILEESQNNLCLEAEAQGLTSKEITRLSLEAFEELDLEEKQG
jgi:hypothetical protein